MNRSQAFAIRFTRLAGGSQQPGLIGLTVQAAGKSSREWRIGALTDAGMRGRLSHFNLHSANQLAAIRHLLSKEKAEASVEESWSGLETCVRFWRGFVGSQIRSLEWTCTDCEKSRREEIGGCVGESFSWVCECGSVNHVTIPKAAYAG